MADKVVVVTGGAGGLGEAHVREFARAGAKVVISDIATDTAMAAAAALVEGIVANGGQAIAVTDDICDETGARSIVDAAVNTFGRLDALVNNAGILRDRMLVNMSLDDWDAVVRVHLRGTFAMTQAAAMHWRSRSKAGTPSSGSIVNTTSAAGLYGNIGQANYAAAKAGVAALTLVAAEELSRYGVRVNAIAPNARTAMTESLFSDSMARPDGEFDVMDPGNASPLVVWLTSEAARGVSGRVFTVLGGKITVNDGWREGVALDIGRKWSDTELDAQLPVLVAQALLPTPVLGTAASGIVPTRT
ncbi:short-chain dehydrogenase [Rhodococcus sp. 15-1154-1]|nr:short-chain dehydrogenase [Rhodococcus sp. 15-1154-1]